MDSFERRIDAFLRRHALLETGEPVVTGLSGGVDSIVLTSVLATLGGPVRAVHVNYRLRGDASDEDEAFVRTWCGERGIDLVVRSFDGEWPSDASVQQAARDFRYAVFEEEALAIPCGKVAVGHHRDDQAETVLLNLFRGSGPEGLAGMPVRREISPGSSVQVVRPLLAERRRDIAAYARAQGLTWREDASNTTPKYRRGALRGDILPLIEQHFGEAVVENIARSGSLVREYVDEVLRDELEACFDVALAGEGAVDEAAVRALPPVFRRRVFIEALRRWAPGFEADARAAGPHRTASGYATGPAARHSEIPLCGGSATGLFLRPLVPDPPANLLLHVVWMRKDPSKYPGDICTSNGWERLPAILLPARLMRCILTRVPPGSPCWCARGRRATGSYRSACARARRSAIF